MLRLTRLVVGDQSLHKQLLLWLLLPQLVLWLAAAFVTYNVAARYANRAIDASLSQATRSLARQVKPIGSGLLIDFPQRGHRHHGRRPGRPRLLHGQHAARPVHPGQQQQAAAAAARAGRPSSGEPYFYDGVVDKMPIRVAGAVPGLRRRQVAPD